MKVSLALFTALVASSPVSARAHPFPSTDPPRAYRLSAPYPDAAALERIPTDDAAAHPLPAFPLAAALDNSHYFQTHAEPSSVDADDNDGVHVHGSSDEDEAGRYATGASASAIERLLSRLGLSGAAAQSLDDTHAHHLAAAEADRHRYLTDEAGPVDVHHAHEHHTHDAHHSQHSHHAHEHEHMHAHAHAPSRAALAEASRTYWRAHVADVIAGARTRLSTLRTVVVAAPVGAQVAPAPTGARDNRAEFAARLHRAVLHLTAPEALGLAFVLGAGLGSLVHLLFMLVLLAARAVRGAGRDGDDVFSRRAARRQRRAERRAAAAVAVDAMLREPLPRYQAVASEKV